MYIVYYNGTNWFKANRVSFVSVSYDAMMKWEMTESLLIALRTISIEYSQFQIILTLTRVNTVYVILNP